MSEHDRGAAHAGATPPEAAGQTGPGRGSRAKDWLIGAAATVLLLLLLLLILWWVFTRPAGHDDGTPAPSPSGGSAATAMPGRDSTPGPTAPTGLLDDELWLGDLEFEAGTAVIAGTTLRDVRAVGEDVISGRDGIVAARLEVDLTVP
ncbi:MAG: hypothetical protein ACQERF_03015, partial [Actinomycetota bacterium]